MRYRNYLFDLDGTLYRGSEIIPYAVERVNQLVENGAGVAFVSNNSAARPRQVAAKLKAMGFRADADQVFATGLLATKFVREKGYRRVLLIGEPSLHETFREANLTPMDSTAVDVVVAGICRTFDYRMVDQASSAIREGAFFLATNTDATYPKEGGAWEPGAGAIVSAIATAALRPPDEILGKPSPHLLVEAMNSLRFNPSETVLVGDRLDTDGEAASAAGIGFWLTLTGHEKVIPTGVEGGKDFRELA
ncbi:MAG: HAD-IIA family hydrolase [Fimbriimonadaceae bacterium]|nr:HAD-IIA family hydrolase [Fimbriimonadaceae bacterium]